MPIPMPPAIYDHQCKKPLSILNMQAGTNIYAICHGPASACSWPGKNGTWVIVLPSDIPSNFRALLLRHEIAHCNGWPRNHPNAHYE